MSLAQKIWLEIEQDINKGDYQSEIERRVQDRPDFKGEETTQEEINLMLRGEKNSLHKELFDKEYHEQAVKMFTDMIDSFNSSSHVETNKAFLEALTRTHRHIQGEFWNNLLKVAYSYSQLDDRFFDGRNAFAKELTAKMCESEKHWLEVTIK